MTGYTPLFGSIVTGSLSGRWPDIGLWCVLLAMADRDGVIDASEDYISTVTGLAIDDVVACIARFCKPDPRSRRPDEHGARLVPLPGRGFGWRVVNHSHYRTKARKIGSDARRAETGENAARMAARREATRPDPARPAVTRPQTQTQTHTQTHTQTQTEDKNRIRASNPARRTDSEPPEFQKIRQAYPKRDGSQRWGDALRAYTKRLQEGATAQQILEGVQRYAEHCRAREIERTEKVQQAATFLGVNRGYLEDFPITRTSKAPDGRARDPSDTSMQGVEDLL